MSPDPSTTAGGSAPLWTCGACGSGNAAESARCVVCDAARPAPAPDAPVPQVPVVPIVSTPPGRGVPAGAAPVRPSTGQLPPAASGVLPPAPTATPLAPPAAVAAAPSGRRSPVGLIVLAVIVVVVAVVVAGIGAYELTKSDDPGTGQAAGGDLDGTTAVSEPSDTAVAPDASEPFDDGAGSGDVGSAGVTASGDFVDDQHLVSFAVPSELSLVQDFDGTTAVWESDDLRFEYEVIPGGSVSDADDRYAELLETLATVTFESDTPEGRSDGRYVASGYYPDGGRIYERGKVRCGDLVSYRLTWLYDETKPLVNQLTESLVNDDPDLDAMGGDHSTC